MGSFRPLQRAFLFQGTLRFRFVLLVSLILTFGHETVPFDRLRKRYCFSESRPSMRLFSKRVDQIPGEFDAGVVLPTVGILWDKEKVPELARIFQLQTSSRI